MSITTYRPSVKYLGTNNFDFTFNFQVGEPKDCWVAKLDSSGNELWIVNGQDRTQLNSFSFNPLGGGQLTLNEALETGQVLWIWLYIPEPVQPSEFASKTRLRLDQLETAVDNLARQSQSQQLQLEGKIGFKPYEREEEEDDDNAVTRDEIREIIEDEFFQLGGTVDQFETVKVFDISTSISLGGADFTQIETGVYGATLTFIPIEQLQMRVSHGNVLRVHHQESAFFNFSGVTNNLGTPLISARVHVNTIWTFSKGSDLTTAQHVEYTEGTTIEFAFLNPLAFPVENLTIDTIIDLNEAPWDQITPDGYLDPERNIPYIDFTHIRMQVQINVLSSDSSVTAASPPTSASWMWEGTQQRITFIQEKRRVVGISGDGGAVGDDIITNVDINTENPSQESTNQGASRRKIAEKFKEILLLRGDVNISETPTAIPDDNDKWIFWKDVESPDRSGVFARDANRDGWLIRDVNISPPAVTILQDGENFYSVFGGDSRNFITGNFVFAYPFPYSPGDNTVSNYSWDFTALRNWDHSISTLQYDLEAVGNEIYFLSRTHFNRNPYRIAEDPFNSDGSTGAVIFKMNPVTRSVIQRKILPQELADGTGTQPEATHRILGIMCISPNEGLIYVPVVPLSPLDITERPIWAFDIGTLERRPRSDIVITSAQLGNFPLTDLINTPSHLMIVGQDGNSYNLKPINKVTRQIETDKELTGQPANLIGYVNGVSSGVYHQGTIHFAPWGVGANALSPPHGLSPAFSQGVLTEYERRKISTQDLSQILGGGGASSNNAIGTRLDKYYIAPPSTDGDIFPVTGAIDTGSGIISINEGIQPLLSLCHTLEIYSSMFIDSVIFPFSNRLNEAPGSYKAYVFELNDLRVNQRNIFGFNQPVIFSPVRPSPPPTINQLTSRLDYSFGLGNLIGISDNTIQIQTVQPGHLLVRRGVFTQGLEKFTFTNLKIEVDKMGPVTNPVSGIGFRRIAILILQIEDSNVNTLNQLKSNFINTDNINSQNPNVCADCQDMRPLPIMFTPIDVSVGDPIKDDPEEYRFAGVIYDRPAYKNAVSPISISYQLIIGGELVPSNGGGADLSTDPIDLTDNANNPDDKAPSASAVGEGLITVKGGLDTRVDDVDDDVTDLDARVTTLEAAVPGGNGFTGPGYWTASENTAFTEDDFLAGAASVGTVLGPYTVPASITDNSGYIGIWLPGTWWDHVLQLDDGAFGFSLGSLDVPVDLTVDGVDGQYRRSRLQQRLEFEGQLLYSRLNIIFDSGTDFQIADGSIGTDQLADDGVTTEKIADDAVTEDKLSDDVVTKLNEMGGGGIPSDGSVTTIKIADDAVTEDKLSDDVVTKLNEMGGGGTPSDGSVTTAKIADDAVTQAKLADDSVGTDQILDDAVTQAKLADGAVGTDQIGNDQITEAKLDPNARMKLNSGGDGNSGISTTQLELKTIDLTITDEKVFTNVLAESHLDNYREAIPSDSQYVASLPATITASTTLDDHTLTQAQAVGNAWGTIEKFTADSNIQAMSLHAWWRILQTCPSTVNPPYVLIAHEGLGGQSGHESTTACGHTTSIFGFFANSRRVNSYILPVGGVTKQFVYDSSVNPTINQVGQIIFSDTIPDSIPSSTEWAPSYTFTAADLSGYIVVRIPIATDIRDYRLSASSYVQYLSDSILIGEDSTHKYYYIPTTPEENIIIRLQQDVNAEVTTDYRGVVSNVKDGSITEDKLDADARMKLNTLASGGKIYIPSVIDTNYRLGHANNSIRNGPHPTIATRIHGTPDSYQGYSLRFKNYKMTLNSVVANDEYTLTISKPSEIFAPYRPTISEYLIESTITISADETNYEATFDLSNTEIVMDHPLLIAVSKTAGTGNINYYIHASSSLGSPTNVIDPYTTNTKEMLLDISRFPIDPVFFTIASFALNTEMTTNQINSNILAFQLEYDIIGLSS